MSTYEVVVLAVTVIEKLYPIVKEVYEAVNDPNQPEITTENVLDVIKVKVYDSLGITIGNTEAELVRSTVHFAEAKKERHSNFIVND